MTFKQFYEASDNLHQWFKRGGKDPKTGKKFSGWVNCKTGGPLVVNLKSQAVVTQHVDLLKVHVKV